MIRRGFSEALDALRDTRDHAVDFIANLQARERERTGIGSLKVGYNKVFGYYIEVTKSHLGRVPDDYHRKQTLTNAERYFTPELKEWEEKVVGAEEAIASSSPSCTGRSGRRSPRRSAVSRPPPTAWRGPTCWRRWPRSRCGRDTSGPRWTTTTASRSGEGDTRWSSA